MLNWADFVTNMGDCENKINKFDHTCDHVLSIKHVCIQEINTFYIAIYIGTITL